MNFILQAKRAWGIDEAQSLIIYHLNAAPCVWHILRSHKTFIYLNLVAYLLVSLINACKQEAGQKWKNESCFRDDSTFLNFAHYC